MAAEYITFSDRIARKRIDSLDVARGFLCLAVMLIHVNPFPDSVRWNIYPAARIAVPLFFLFTGFLFFRRYDTVDDKKQRAAMTRKFVKRLLLMYLGWFVILLYPTLMLRPWYLSGFVVGTIELLRSTIVGSSFIASWYLMSSAIAMYLLTKLDRRVPEWAILLLAAFLYLNCCVFTNYSNLAAEGPLHAIVQFWHTLRISPHISIPAAFFWLAISHSLTKRLDSVVTWLERYGVLPLLVFVGMALLYFEHAGIQSLHLGSANVCYLFLPPIAVFLFVSVVTSTFSCRTATSIRHWSSVTYPAHATVRYIVEQVVTPRGIVLTNWMYFVIVFVICVVLTWVIVSLSKHERLRFLRWLY